MSVTLGDAVVYLVTDDSRLKQGLQQGEAHVQGFGSRVSGFLMNAASFAVGGFIQQGISAITSSIGGLASKMITSNAAFEDYETRFKVLLGTSEQAKQRMQELADFGARTPFELPGVVEADLILQGFGLHSEEAAKKFGFTGVQIREIAGDVASGTGQSFSEIAGYLGRFAAGDTGFVIRRMQELGITTREQMAGMGLEFSKAGQLLTPVPEAFNVLLKVMKDKYGGLMAEQSLTFNGMMSNLQDWIGNAARVMGKPIFDAFKNGLQQLLGFLSDPGTLAALSGFAESIGVGIGVALDFLSSSIGTVLPYITLLRDYFLAIIEDGDTLNDWLTHFPEGWQPVILVIGEVVNFIVNSLLPTLTQLGSDIINIVIPALIQFVEPIIAFILPGLALLATGIMYLVSAVLPLLAAAWTWITENMNIILPVLGVIGVLILALTSPISLVIAAIVLLASLWANNWMGIQDIVFGVWNFIQPYIAAAMAYISTVISTVLAAIQAWWTQHGASVMVLIQALWTFLQFLFNAGMTTIMTVIMVVGALIQGFWQTWGNTLTAIMQAAWDVIKTIVQTTMDLIGFIIDAAAALIRGDWQGFADALRGIWDTLWNAMTSILQAAKGVLVGLVTDLVNQVKGLFTNISGGIQGAWDNLWNTLKNTVQAATDAIIGWVEDMLGWIQDAIDALLQLIGLQGGTEQPPAAQGSPELSGPGPGALGAMGNRSSVQTSTTNFVLNQTVYGSPNELQDLSILQTIPVM